LLVERNLRELLSGGSLGLSLFNLNIIRTNSKLEAKLLGFSASGSHENGIHMNWDTLLLSQLNSDGRRPIGNEVLHLASGNVSIHKLEYVVFVRFLSQFDCNRARSISDKVFQLSA
jgi:hypothetical protein